MNNDGAFDYDKYTDKKAAEAHAAQEKAREAAEKRQIAEVDAKEEAYRKKHKIGPEVKGYQHMIAAEADAKKDARLNAEWDKIRGEIGVNQATKARRDKDIKSGQTSLLLDDPYKDPNRAEMEKRAVKDQDAKAARSGSKGPSGGGGSGGMGTGKMNRDISKNMKKGGKISSASKRADGIAMKGKTRGKMC